MGEKKKNSAQKHTLKSFLIRLVFFVVSFPMFCGVCVSLIVATDYVIDYQCFSEGKELEWNGSVYVANAPESSPLINEENATELAILNSEGLNITLPERLYNRPLSHPQHAYFLTVKRSEGAALAVCRGNVWASDLLSQRVNFYNFSPDGQFFALSSTNTIEIYDADSIDLYRIVEFPELEMVAETAFHPTEPLVAFIGKIRSDEGLYIWNYETQELVAEFPSLGGWIGFLAFNEDGTLLVVVNDAIGGGITVWGIPPE